MFKWLNLTAFMGSHDVAGSHGVPGRREKSRHTLGSHNNFRKFTHHLACGQINVQMGKFRRISQKVTTSRKVMASWKVTACSQASRLCDSNGCESNLNAEPRLGGRSNEPISAIYTSDAETQSIEEIIQKERKREAALMLLETMKEERAGVTLDMRKNDLRYQSKITRMENGEAA